MIIDSLQLISVASLPQPTTSGLVSVVYLTTTDGSFEPGFYFNTGAEWAPFGASGSGVQNFELTTSSTETLDLSQFSADGIILSILITKNVGAARQVTILRTADQLVLETVVLEDVYTTIAVPNPHTLYSLVLESDLTINIKTI